MKLFLLLIFFKIFIITNFFHLHQKKISQLNIRKTERSPLSDDDFEYDTNTILIKVYSESYTQSKIQYINNFQAEKVLMFIHGIEKTLTKEITLGQEKTEEDIELIFPKNFSGSCKGMFFWV